MTPAEERQQLRDVYFLKETVSRLEKEARERDQQLAKHERRIQSIGNTVGGVGMAVIAVISYVAYERAHGFWEVAILAAAMLFWLWVLHNSLRGFYKG